MSSAVRKHPLICDAGWHGEEHDGVRPFRWMTRRAECRTDKDLPAGRVFLLMEAGHPFAGPARPELEIRVDDRSVGTRKIEGPFGRYVIPVDIRPNSSIVFQLDGDRLVDGDTRRLGIMVSDPGILVPDELNEVFYGEGWHDLEVDEFLPFRWMAHEARVILPPYKPGEASMLSLSVFSEYMDLSQNLELRLGGRLLGRAALLNKWNYYSFSLDPAEPPYIATWPDEAVASDAAGAGPGDHPRELVLTLSKVLPPGHHGESGREIGARIGPIALHDDAAWHETFRFFHDNALLNYREMIEGRTELRSFPLTLGIDLYAKCNIHPPCVYCLWDKMKVLEGADIDAVVDKAALEGYGPFFRAARTLVNCSFGEPLLHPGIGDILEFCGRNRKIVELSTNGQAFTERTIAALAGQPVFLYVSLDAATAETYARIRNDRWDRVLPNLIRLNEARKKAGNLPKIYMVFMPMRVNRGDLEEYFRLCRRIDADALVLRPLLYLVNPDIQADRGGYHFNYADELLGREDLEDVFRDCEAFSRKYGVPVANQFNFGKIEK